MLDANGRSWSRGTAVLDESKLDADATRAGTTYRSCKSGLTVKVRELFIAFGVCALSSG
jgi:hypothetical protein